MSERGSFVTEYVYCRRCFDVARGVLLRREKYLCSVVVPSWEPGGGELPIIAGKIGGLGPGDDLTGFLDDVLPELAQGLCHPLRIAILAESGNAIHTAAPCASTPAVSPSWNRGSPP